ncbi:MAG TPA: LLM class F420-dependent oxidoreductase [Candidatus Limnocylindrales bacterium]|nr:LLM class F420-dependent oxidoreductase [Candidatus Limnocylindrales bacterium]
MRIGLMIEGQEGLTWERWFRIAGRVEEAGLDSLWRSDHFFSVMGRPERPSLEAWTSLAALAERTRRIRFGPLVSPMTFRHPALLARMAAAVDLLSNGRLVLGVGAGWNEEEHAAYAIALPPMRERMDRLEEGIDVIRALWTGGPVTREGRYYPLRGATGLPRPAQSPGPPILIGGDGEQRLLRIVAQHADEWNSHAHGVDAYRHKRAKLEEHCRAVSRDPQAIARSLMTGVLIASDPAGVAERGRWFKAFLPSLAAASAVEVAAVLRERGWLVGTPEVVAGQLREWESAGVQRVMLQYFDLDDMDGIGLLGQLARSVP